MRITLPLMGQAYEHRSMDLSAQSLKNWYPEFNNEVQAVISLQPWPGLTEFAETPGRVDGGAFEFKGQVYKITDQTLYRVAENSSAIGEVLGDGLCSVITTEFEAIIVRSGYVYRLLVEPDTLTKASDPVDNPEPDFESPDFVSYMNNQAIYDGNNGRFVVSDAGKLVDINGLNYATAESSGDKLIRPFVHRQMLYLLGEKTIEPWYNSGVGNPPFDRIQNGIIERGLLAPYSVASNHATAYFLGDDHVVYRLIGGQLNAPVSTLPISQFVAACPTKEKAVGACLDFAGLHFYVLSFPQSKTWAFCEESKSWFEITTGYREKGLEFGSSLSVNGKIMLSQGNKVLSLAKTIFSQTIRERASTAVTAALLGRQYEGRSLQYDSIELIAKIIPPVGVTPRIGLSWSDDNGRTWSAERLMEGGQAGQYTWRLRAYQLGQAYERVFRVRFSEDAFCSIQGCTAEVGLGIG